MSRRFGTAKKVRPARQARSRATLDRILEATLGLLDGRDFEELPVAAIIDAAGISASSLYARFPTKATLLQALHERHLANARALVDGFAAAERGRARDPREVVAALIRLFLEFQTNHDGPARTFRYAEAHDPGFARRRQELDTYAIRLVADWLLAQYAPAERPRHARRVELAVWLLCTGMIGALQPPYRFADVIGMSRDEMAEEVAAMLLRYLGLPSRDG